MRTTFLNRSIQNPEPPVNRVGHVEADKFIVIDEPSDINKGLLYSDFNLQNVIENGMADLLRPAPLLHGSDFNAIDNLNTLENSPVFDDGVIPDDKPKKDKSKKDEESV